MPSHPSISQLVKRTYIRQCNHSLERGHSLPKYSEEELLGWYRKQPNIDKLYQDYISSYKKEGYNKRQHYDMMLSLSPDRIDNSKGYSFSNLKPLSTFRDNNAAWHEHISQGVNLYSTSGKYLKSFKSISSCARYIGCSPGNVYSALNFGQNTIYRSFQVRSSEVGTDDISEYVPLSKVKARVPIIQLNLDGSVVKVWESQSLVRDFYKVSGLSRHLRKERKTWQGFIWLRYLEYIDSQSKSK